MIYNLLTQTTGYWNVRTGSKLWKELEKSTLSARSRLCCFFNQEENRSEKKKNTLILFCEAGHVSGSLCMVSSIENYTVM